jgi:hypothetical protein
LGLSDCISNSDELLELALLKLALVDIGCLLDELLELALLEGIILFKSPSSPLSILNLDPLKLLVFDGDNDNDGGDNDNDDEILLPDVFAAEILLPDVFAAEIEPTFAAGDAEADIGGEP